MSRAIECDICGQLVPVGSALTLEVNIPKPGMTSEALSWSDIDVCWSCVKNATLYAVVHSGCDESEGALNALAE